MRSQFWGISSSWRLRTVHLRKLQILLFFEGSQPWHVGWSCQVTVVTYFHARDREQNYRWNHQRPNRSQHMLSPDGKNVCYWSAQVTRAPCLCRSFSDICLRFFLTHLLTFLLTYLMALFLTYLLTFFLILFLASLVNIFLTYPLTFFLTYLLTFFLAYVLAFCLTVFLTYLLTFCLTSLLTLFLTFFLAYLLTFCVTVFLTFFLTFLLRHSSGWHSFWHSFWHIPWHSFWLSSWHIFWYSFLTFCLAGEVRQWQGTVAADGRGWGLAGNTGRRSSGPPSNTGRGWSRFRGRLPVVVAVGARQGTLDLHKISQPSTDSFENVPFLHKKFAKTAKNRKNGKFWLVTVKDGGFQNTPKMTFFQHYPYFPQPTKNSEKKSKNVVFNAFGYSGWWRLRTAYFRKLQRKPFFKNKPFFSKKNMPKMSFSMFLGGYGVFHKTSKNDTFQNGHVFQEKTCRKSKQCRFQCFWVVPASDG